MATMFTPTSLQLTEAHEFISSYLPVRPLSLKALCAKRIVELDLPTTAAPIECSILVSKELERNTRETTAQELLTDKDDLPSTLYYIAAGLDTAALDFPTRIRAALLLEVVCEAGDDPFVRRHATSNALIPSLLCEDRCIRSTFANIIGTLIRVGCRSLSEIREIIPALIRSGTRDDSVLALRLISYILDDPESQNIIVDTLPLVLSWLTSSDARCADAAFDVITDLLLYARARYLDAQELDTEHVIQQIIDQRVAVHDQVPPFVALLRYFDAKHRTSDVHMAYATRLLNHDRYDKRAIAEVLSTMRSSFIQDRFNDLREPLPNFPACDVLEFLEFSEIECFWHGVPEVVTHREKRTLIVDAAGKVPSEPSLRHTSLPSNIDNLRTEAFGLFAFWADRNPQLALEFVQREIPSRLASKRVCTREAAFQCLLAMYPIEYPGARGLVAGITALLGGQVAAVRDSLTCDQVVVRTVARRCWYTYKVPVDLLQSQP